MNIFNYGDEVEKAYGRKTATIGKVRSVNGPWRNYKTGRNEYFYDVVWGKNPGYYSYPESGLVFSPHNPLDIKDYL